MKAFPRISLGWALTGQALYISAFNHIETEMEMILVYQQQQQSGEKTLRQLALLSMNLPALTQQSITV